MPTPEPRLSQARAHETPFCSVIRAYAPQCFLVRFESGISSTKVTPEAARPSSQSAISRGEVGGDDCGSPPCFPLRLSQGCRTGFTKRRQGPVAWSQQSGAAHGFPEFGQAARVGGLAGPQFSRNVRGAETSGQSHQGHILEAGGCGPGGHRRLSMGNRYRRLEGQDKCRDFVQVMSRGGVHISPSSSWHPWGSPATCCKP